MLRDSIPLLIGTLSCVLLLAACGGQSSTAPPVTAPTPTVTSVTVSGIAPQVGGTASFTAMATLSDGTTQNVTTQASWRSSNVSVATVSTSGVVSGVGPGDADITATYSSVSGSQHVRIGLRTFAVSGIVADDRGRSVTNAAVKVVDGEKVGVSSTTDQNGSYTLSGLRPGSFAIRAQADGSSRSTSRSRSMPRTFVSTSICAGCPARMSCVPIRRKPWRRAARNRPISSARQVAAPGKPRPT